MVGVMARLSDSVCLFVSLSQGCGKSVVAREFAAMLGYSVEPVMLYQVLETSHSQWLLASVASPWL